MSSQPEQAVAVAGDRVTVLLVEDHEPARAVVGQMLRDRGYVVIPAGNAAEATALSRRYRGQIEVVVTDSVLPGTSGNKLLVELAQTQPQARPLLVSGRLAGDIVSCDPRGEPLPFLAKPFTGDELAQAVDDVLADPRCRLRGWQSDSRGARTRL